MPKFTWKRGLAEESAVEESDGVATVNITTEELARMPTA